ncbi:uncharacterized protein C19orf44 [Hydra vulgaris]|uniref:Uncharacterized protein C19orf44 n=1 Tax=Hydra vulgaris TaxID=6087 RepID=A0ABM4B661_HYDVU
MKNSVDKWKLGVLKVKAKESSSILCNTDNGGEAILNGVLDETKDMEIASYLSSLKKKTSLKNLWSGQTFYDIVDGDQTPDISSESDSELNLKVSKNVHDLGNLRLDSDEDEMRINYMRELNEIDENNNILSSSESSYNVMGNIHYAQLELDEVQLSADNKLENKNDSLDFFPVLHNLHENNPRSNENSTLIGSASEISEVISNSKIHKEKYKKVSHRSTTENLSEINTSQSLNRSISELSYSKSSSFKKKNAKKIFSKSLMSEDTYSEVKQKLTDETLSKSSKTEKSKPTLLRKSKSNSEDSYTLNSNVSYSSLPLSKSSSTRSNTHNSKVPRNSTPSVSSKSLSTCSKVSKHKKSRSQRRHTEEIGQTKNMGSQTDFKSDDKTKEVLSYLYSWQLPHSSNIAAHVMDADTIELYSNLNPAMLAANDMMKYHLHLVRMHLNNSRRLYESYANENINNNYNYTSVEETMAYIHQNSPKVISYEQALKHVKSSYRQ